MTSIASSILTIAVSVLPDKAAQNGGVMQAVDRELRAPGWPIARLRANKAIAAPVLP
jgi:hypothetical protein